MSRKILRRLTLVLFALSATCGLTASPSFAIAPAGQTISPTYDGVVRVLIDEGLPGGQGFFEGTGSVVGNTNVNGNGYLWILTRKRGRDGYINQMLLVPGAKERGLIDNKTCSIDEDRSGIRFVVPRALRKKDS